MEVFNNEQFGSVCIIEEADKYLFCGLDVAAALGYAKAQKRDHRPLPVRPETGRTPSARPK